MVQPGDPAHPRLDAVGIEVVELHAADARLTAGRPEVLLEDRSVHWPAKSRDGRLDFLADVRLGRRLAGKSAPQGDRAEAFDVMVPPRTVPSQSDGLPEVGATVVGPHVAAAGRPAELLIGGPLTPALTMM